LDLGIGIIHGHVVGTTGHVAGGGAFTAANRPLPLTEVPVSLVIVPPKSAQNVRSLAMTFTPTLP
jgi:hypothetical protein